MSLPIHRVDLQNAASPKLNLSSVVLPETATFPDKRVLTLSKQIVAAAKEGKKTVTVNIVVEKNVEPVSAGLKVNFPDATITVNSNSNPAGGRVATPIVIDWS